MEIHLLPAGQALVEDDRHPPVGVLEQPERRNLAGMKPEAAVQPLVRGEAQPVVPERFGHGAEIHLFEELGDEQIMMIALLVPEEEVLAVPPLDALPMDERFLDREDGRMLMPDERNPQGGQGLVDQLFAPLRHARLDSPD
jgi:hypothetical protein